MLTLEQFRKLYPDWTYLVEPWAGMYEGEPRVIAEGFLQFTEETAFRWAGPFPGNHCRFILKDWTHATKSWGPDKGKNILELYQKGRDEVQEKIARGYYEYHKDKTPYTFEDYPSFEKPIALVMYGNDDTSYTKFYPTEKAALEELNLFVENEPLDAHNVVDGFGFIFTN